jgi:hypothetical protein
VCVCGGESSCDGRMEVYIAPVFIASALLEARGQFHILAAVPQIMSHFRAGLDSREETEPRLSCL